MVEAVKQIKQLANRIRELSQAAVLATEQGEKTAIETRETATQINLITNQQRHDLNRDGRYGFKRICRQIRCKSRCHDDDHGFTNRTRQGK